MTSRKQRVQLALNGRKVNWLANVSEVRQDMLSAWINERRSLPSHKIETIALALDLRLEWLMSGEGEMRPSVPASGGQVSTPVHSGIAPGLAALITDFSFVSAWHPSAEDIVALSKIDFGFEADTRLYFEVFRALLRLRNEKDPRERAYLNNDGNDRRKGK